MRIVQQLGSWVVGVKRRPWVKATEDQMFHWVRGAEVCYMLSDSFDSWIGTMKAFEEWTDDDCQEFVRTYVKG